MKESKLQKQVIQHLASDGYLAIPVEARGRRGFPDLIVFALNKPTSVCFLELKTATGKCSYIQTQTARLFRLWGHEIGITRSVEESLEHCRKVFYGNQEKDPQTTPETQMRQLPR